MGLPTISKQLIWLPVLGLLLLGGAAYRTFATGGGGSTAATRNNLRQPIANTKGLVAWYPLDGDTKDYSGNHNDGTATNFTYDGTTNGWINGKFGKGLLFNGSSDYVDLPASLALSATQSYSITAWFKPASSTSYGTIITDHGGDSNSKVFLGSFLGSQTVNWDSGLYGVSSGINPSANVWHLLTLTYVSAGTNTGTQSISVDGGTPVTRTGAVPAWRGNFRIGATAAINFYFSGSTDDVRIYNRALSASEISQLYAGSPSQTCDQTCKIWLKFDDNTGTTAKDSVYGGVTATLSGATTWTTGNFASAVTLDGSTGSVSVPDLGMGAGTVDMWINPVSVSGDQRLFAQASGASTQAGQLALNQTSGENGSLWVWDGAAWQRLSADGSVLAGQWNQVVVANNGGTVTGYVNGTRQLTTAAAFNFSGVGANIGGKFLGTAGGTFNGAIDDFRIYARILAPEEVADQWRQGT